MYTLIVFIIIIFCVLLYSTYQHKTFKQDHSLLVGRSKYSIESVKSFYHFSFKNDKKKNEYSFNYKVVEFTDTKSSLEFKNGDLLLFDIHRCPHAWKGHYMLMKNDKDEYRIAQCIAETMNMPEIYDGNETPGIGYNIIGFLKYKINADTLDKKEVSANRYF